MFKGKALQIDNATQLYEAPSCREVADFIGTMNFLDGVLSDVAGGDQAVVQTAGIGPLRALKGGLAPTPTMPVTIAILPATVQITWDRPPRGPNELGARTIGGQGKG